MNNLDDDILESMAKRQYERLLYSAKMNLESSKILYREENYADSFNLFIQSVEKMGKTLEIFMRKKPLTEDKLKRKIGHQTIKIYEGRAIELSKKLRSEDDEIFNIFKEIVNVGPIQKEIDDFNSLIESIKKDKLYVIYLSEKMINEIISDVDKDNERLKRSKLEKDKKDIHSFIKNSEGILFMYRSLVRLSIITLHHYEITKYPDTEDDSLSPEIYIKELPIIKKLPDLFRIQGDIIYEFGELEKF